MRPVQTRSRLATPRFLSLMLMWLVSASPCFGQALTQALPPLVAWDEPPVTDDMVWEETFSDPASAAICDSRGNGPGQRWEQLSFLAAIDGAKQPQDFGVNADLGVRLRANYAAPLWESYGLGYQIGSAVNWTDNAVTVFEFLGEDTNRFQSHTTIGLFQRLSRYGWGVVYDHLYQDGFDKATLGQIRSRVSCDVTPRTQLGLEGRLRARDDTSFFLGAPVTLRSINQGSVYWRHLFETGVQSSWYFGIAGQHSEDNVATGVRQVRDKSFVLGADFTAPLNDSLALYGETNLIMPADTGTVDAFFGMIWYPFGNAKTAFRKRFSPMMPVAAATSFAVDLVP